jgi:DNA invertase Pin-like site-specific DNA recombinase
MIESSPQNRHLGCARVSTSGIRSTLSSKVLRRRLRQSLPPKASGAQINRLARPGARAARQGRRAHRHAPRPLGALHPFLNTLAAVTGKGAGFRSLHDTWADTTTAHGRLMLTVLGGLAEFKGELIRARTGEGRARAKAKGVRMGRKPKLTRHQQEAIKRLNIGKETQGEIARSYDVSRWTISRFSAE